jgi:hypothetical protein
MGGQPLFNYIKSNFMIHRSPDIHRVVKSQGPQLAGRVDQIMESRYSWKI